jgi:O-antigen/teichoic acid export membrane protein
LIDDPERPGVSATPLLRRWYLWVAAEQQAFEAVLANGLIAFSVFASSVVMAHALGPEGRGRVAAHLAGIVTSVALGSLGISYAAAYGAARSGRSRSAFRAICTLGAGSLALTVLLDVGVEVLVVRSSASAEAAWAVAGALLGQAAGITTGWMQGSRAMRSWNALRACPYALHLGILLVLWRAGALNVERSIGAFAAAQAVAAVVGLFLVRTVPIAGDGPSASGFGVREAWRFARGIAISAVLYQLNQRLDQLCLAFLNRSEDLGIYASSVTLAGLGFPMGVGLAQATYAEGLHLSSLERGRLARRRNRVALIATSACALVVTVFARPLMVLLYGPAFAGGAPALAVLSWGTVFLAGNYVATESLRSAGKSAATIRADAIAVGVSLVLLPIGIARLGILGAAVVSVFSYLLGYVLNLRASIRWNTQGAPSNGI